MLRYVQLGAERSLPISARGVCHPPDAAEPDAYADRDVEPNADRDTHANGYAHCKLYPDGNPNRHADRNSDGDADDYTDIHPYRDIHPESDTDDHADLNEDAHTYQHANDYQNANDDTDVHSPQLCQPVRRPRPGRSRARDHRWLLTDKLRVYRNGDHLHQRPSVQRERSGFGRIRYRGSESNL
jgi:hypothetical protein